MIRLLVSISSRKETEEKILREQTCVLRQTLETLQSIADILTILHEDRISEIERKKQIKLKEVDDLKEEIAAVFRKMDRENQN